MSRECFVVCPIGDDGDDIRQRADDVTDYIIEPVLSRYGITISRADRLGFPGNITSQIIDKVLKADLVIADLTGNNPNVFYELALRHITRKPYIQMAQIGQRIPFDVTTQRTIFYDLNIRFAQRAKDELNAQVQTVLESDYRVESPITAAIDLSALGSEDPLGRTLTQINATLSEIQQAITSDKRFASIQVPNIPLIFLQSHKIDKIKAIVESFEAMAKKLDGYSVEYEMLYVQGATQAEFDVLEEEFSRLTHDLNFNYEILMRILNSPV